MTPLRRSEEGFGAWRATSMRDASLPWPPGVDAGKGDAPQQPAWAPRAFSLAENGEASSQAPPSPSAESQSAPPQLVTS